MPHPFLSEVHFGMQVGDEAVHGGSSYLSDTQSSDQKFYNDMILACQVSRSGSSDIIQHVKLKAGKLVQ